jgi:aminoglycoside phosphotransferase (APT) family kinase protein
MVDEAELLAALKAALRADPAGRPPGDLVVVRRGLRRRSTIYFVGVHQGDGATPTIVVKCPSPEVERLGIRPPMTVQEQYAAVQRLHEFLAGSDTQFAAPRGVALLPEFDALAMEFVQGRSVWELVRPSAIWRQHELREGVRSGGLALRQLHTIEPTGSAPVDLAEVERTAFSDSRDALRGVDTLMRDGWFSPGAQPAGGVLGKVVLLHGDWAPENVMIGQDRVFCLDPELTDRGWPEYDLARFLLMLLDRSLFVTTGALGWSALRRDLIRTFLTAYYGGQAVSPLLRPLLVREVAQRWAVRHQEAQRGSAAARKARSLLLTRYFGGVLDEISDPRWVESAIG